jgi:glycosyltransferase involved in cell wall biosynthesis
VLMDRPVIACFATQGSGSTDEGRIVELLEDLHATVLRFSRSDRRATCVSIIREIRRLRPEVVVMEGTGLAGGLAVMAARLTEGTPYIVSSGDAVGPYIRMAHPRLGLAAGAYERLLWRLSAGCIAWSPYLAGRALTLGAPRAMTAANWAPPASAAGDRDAVRSRLGIPVDAVVFGIVGSLGWNKRVQYCYGLELVRAIRQTDRGDIRVLVVGGGSGQARLDQLGRGDPRVIIVGRVPREDVTDYLAAIDVASLPQSRDRVGSFRYTTKLSEYLAAGLPIVTAEIPLAYDLDDGWIWRLPGSAPWDRDYVDTLASLMASISPDEVQQRRRLVPRESPLFSKERQQRQVASFVRDVATTNRRAENVRA